MQQESLNKYRVFYLCAYSNAQIQPGCCPGLGCVLDPHLPALSSAARDEVAVHADWSQLALVTQERLQHGHHLLPAGFPSGRHCL